MKVDDNRKVISHIVKFVDPEYVGNVKALNLIGAGKRKLKKCSSRLHVSKSWIR